MEGIGDARKYDSGQLTSPGAIGFDEGKTNNAA